MKEQLMIEKKDAIKMYPTASPEWKAAFETTFGKEVFSQKITDRVKTFEDACEVLGIDSEDVFYSDESDDEKAYKKLKVIARALNEGWTPNWNDSNQRKWYPWFYMNGSGFRLFGVYYVDDFSGVGSRLVFKSEELGQYAADQFSGLYSDLLEL